MRSAKRPSHKHTPMHSMETVQLSHVTTLRFQSQLKLDVQVDAIVRNVCVRCGFSKNCLSTNAEAEQTSRTL